MSVTVNKTTGAITAVYFQVRTGKAAKTKELADGVMLADYNAKGDLLGVEMLGPCTSRVLDKIKVDRPALDFIRRSAPRELVPI